MESYENCEEISWPVSLSFLLTVLTTYLSLARTHGTPTKQKTTTTITIKSELEHFAYRKTDTLADF